MDASTVREIVALGGPHVVEVNGDSYSDSRLYKIDFCNVADPIVTHTLSSVVGYFSEVAEKDEVDPKYYMVHVVDHETVAIISCLNGDRKREQILKATAIGPRFRFGEFINNENFTIQLQSMFADDSKTDKDLVLKFAGTVTAGTIKEYGDDGVTQKATIKTGITLKKEAVIPSPCVLRPFRTFLDVQQPSSKFIFRMREGRDCVESALFTADGDSWKHEAMNNIYDYLHLALEPMGVTVLM